MVLFDSLFKFVSLLKEWVFYSYLTNKNGIRTESNESVTSYVCNKSN